MSSNYYQSTTGDSFVNACFIKPTYRKTIGVFFSFVFSWMQRPNVIFASCLIFLFLLPLIFITNKGNSYPKITRLYNVSRLSILTLFHRICYIYLIIIPLAFLINQKPPCKRVGGNDSSLYNFPNASYSMFCMVILYGISLCQSKRYIARIILYLILLLSPIHMILCGHDSVGQALFTLCFTYVLHYYSLRVPFWVLHIENIVLPIFSIVLYSMDNVRFMNSEIMIPRAIRALVLWMIDSFMLIRYQLTRYGFISIGRPIDLGLETEKKSGTYFAILSSESEDIFMRNIRNDLLDAVISMIFSIFGLFLIRLFSGQSTITDFGVI